MVNGYFIILLQVEVGVIAQIWVLFEEDRSQNSILSTEIFIS